MNSPSFLLHSLPLSSPGIRQTSLPLDSTAWSSSIRARCTPSMDLIVSFPPSPARSAWTSATASRQSSKSRGLTEGWIVRTSPERDLSIRSSPRGGAPPVPLSDGGVRRTAPIAAGRTRRADEWGRTASSRIRLSSILPLGRPRVLPRHVPSTSIVLLPAAEAPSSPSVVVTRTPRAECSPAMFSSTSSLSSSLLRPCITAGSLDWRRRRSSTRER
mmetsp:Transcript_38941/g.117123  ORF Transcript_38941/g.117123 Transcript_38941/m.117123 type:complete len:216 (+) Transcript_38941:577-1224(+)